jgi:hypothetical protein
MTAERDPEPRHSRVRVTAHPGTILATVGVIVLLIGLAIEANAPIVIGLVAAIVGAAVGGARRTHD